MKWLVKKMLYALRLHIDKENINRISRKIRETKPKIMVGLERLFDTVPSRDHLKTAEV